MRHNSITNSLQARTHRACVCACACARPCEPPLLTCTRGPQLPSPSVAKQAPPPPLPLLLLLLLMASPILDLDRVRVRLDRRLDWPVRTSSDHSGRQRSLPFEFILCRERVLILKALLSGATPKYSGTHCCSSGKLT